MAFWLDDKLERSLANRFVEQLAIKIPGIEYPISSLSGGNQQKVLLSRWLLTKPQFLILDEPTNDLDIQTLTILEDYLDTFAGS